MELRQLAAEGFRNLAAFQLEPSSRFNVFEGHNGQGKTNLLEAIHLLGAFRSHREARAADMVSHGSTSAAVRGELVREGVTRTLEVQLLPKGKKVQLDGKAITTLAEAASHLTAVVFGPEDLGLTRGGPSPRRAFLDRAVYGTDPSHLGAVKAFRQALDARNRLLRDGRESGGRRLDLAVIEAFEDALATHGLRVILGRLRFLEGFRPHFQRILSSLSEGELAGDVALSISWPVAPAGLRELEAEAPRVRERWRAALSFSRETDLRLGYTRAGPQTDDLVCTLGGRDLRPFASQGQHRAFVLALKLAELEVTREALGIYPVFLLDDVSSELDARRNAHLMRTLEGAGGQVFITTTDVAYLRLGAAHLRRFRVDGGRVEAV